MKEYNNNRHFKELWKRFFQGSFCGIMVSMDNLKDNYSNKSFRYMVIGIATMVAMALVTAITFGRFIVMINDVEKESDKFYEQHFVFVGEDVDSEFWNEVYVSAREQAEKDNIYLEDIKESLNVNYSNEDLLRVAINSSADGIIYAGSSDKEVAKLINKAVGKNIGVCVLHNDVDQSKRQCYVGVNNYELGQMYAYQVIKLLNSNNDKLEDSSLALLVSGEMSEGAVNLVILAIEDAFLEIVEEDNIPEIEVIRIDAEDTFSVEENIRNIFTTEEKLPDIVICLEGAYTQCVYQAVVDYNHVGEVNIIGYSSNNDIIDGIDKGIIFSTVSVDTAEMGQSSVLAIEEYNEMGYTNSFMPITMEIIDKEKASELIKKNMREEEQ